MTHISCLVQNIHELVKMVSRLVKLSQATGMSLNDLKSRLAEILAEPFYQGAEFETDPERRDHATQVLWSQMFSRPRLVQLEEERSRYKPPPPRTHPDYIVGIQVIEPGGE